MKLGGDLEGYSEDEDKIVYHYGKPGERLKNADESVKRYYAGEGPQAPIVVLSSIMDRGAKAATVGLVPMELSTFSFEDTVYISLQLKENSRIDFSEHPFVSCNFLVYTTDQQVIYQETVETFYTGKEDFLRTTFGDYDILYVEAVVTVGSDTKILRSDITRS